MTAQILTSELSSLIQETKRKNTELRHAAEKSLNDLKALPATSETQLGADLSRRTNFINPLLSSCKTRNDRYANSGVICLQRLVVSRGIPKERLKEVLEAFAECTALGLDTQLKILQALPSLLQNYSDEIKGEVLGKLLITCSALQGTKNAIVNRTAAATLQQLVVAVFDKVVAEDKRWQEIPVIEELRIEETVIQVRSAALDAYKVLSDLCVILDGGKAQLLQSMAMPQGSCLELIESILTNHADMFLEHKELGQILRAQLMPYIIKSLSERVAFATAVRATRVLYLLLKRHIDIMPSECEMALSLLTHMLDPDAAAPWKRVLCMEVMRGLFSDPHLIRKIYAHFDEREENKSILQNQLAALVRLATEKPALIGLGHQSSVPIRQSISKDAAGDQATMEAAGVTGIIGTTVGVNEVDTVGISAQWSSVRVAYMDQLDKSEPPVPPETYLYSMILTCIGSLSEGLAKFVIPLTMPAERGSRKKARLSGTEELDEGGILSSDEKNIPERPRQRPRGFSYRKSQVPTNPLTLIGDALYPQIKTCAFIIESCWPAILATCSTFLNATLDAEFYHGLVRAIQKFTHVAGLLRLSTPRDAFLTALAKAAVPPQLFTSQVSPISSPSSESQRRSASGGFFGSIDNRTSSATTTSDKGHTGLVETDNIVINTRNLLCLRALLNLGIALGPTLQDGWSIILETLQQADLILFTSARRVSRQSSGFNQKGEGQPVDEEDLLYNMGTEITAVETAASRMIESTTDYPNTAFLDMISALCKLLTPARPSSSSQRISKTPSMTLSPSIPRTHQRIPSISGALSSLTFNTQGQEFALSKLAQVAELNTYRFTHDEASESGWDYVAVELIKLCSSDDSGPSVRMASANVLNAIIVQAATSTTSEPIELRNQIQRRALSTLRKEISSLDESNISTFGSDHGIILDIHATALEALKSILEQCGEALVAGWELVFDIIGTIFVQDESDGSRLDDHPITYHVKARAPKLVNSGFGSLNLICSDFLYSLPNSCLMTLINTLLRFSSQSLDLNIALTTVTFFWSLSDFFPVARDALMSNERVLRADNEADLLVLASSTDEQATKAGLWMILLRRLTSITTDHRSEVRNGAVHTLLRIFEAYGERLIPDAWNICLRLIIFEAINANINKRVEFDREQEHNRDKLDTSWDETTIILIKGVTQLFAEYIDLISKQTNTRASWDELMSYLEVLSRRQSLDIDATIFNGITQVLNQPESGTKLGPDSIELTWTFWSSDIPSSTTTARDPKLSNQDTLLAYVKCFESLYPLTKNDINVERVSQISLNLQECVRRSDSPPYTSDVDYLTPLQTQVLHSYGLIRTDVSGVPPVLLKGLAALSSLAYENRDSTSTVRRPTYVALSKAAMENMQQFLLHQTGSIDVYTTGAFATTLESLSKPIGLKYNWNTSGREPSTWKVATSASLAILNSAVPSIERLDLTEKVLKQLWERIISIVDGIVSADCSRAPSSTDIIADQDFDMTSFKSLHDRLVPNLGASYISDKTRRAFATSLFNNSFVHPPGRQDVPLIDGQGILAEFYKVRMGRTFDPAPSSRSKMAYVCLDELFSLVAASQNKSAERSRLASAVSPFVILRAAVTLKSYIADQPLRGRMPLPLSQRMELLHILKSIQALNCEPNAIPDAEGVHSHFKKHLVRLYPLITKAVGVAGQDGEVLCELRQCLEIVGDEFGLE